MKDPKLTLHRATGQWYIRFSGTCHYLGRDKKKAERERLRLLLQWHDSGGITPTRPAQDQITIVEVFDRWIAHAVGYYGASSPHLKTLCNVCKLFLEAHADLPACEFGPVRLKAWRRSLCAGNPDKKTANTRHTINKKVRQIVSVFKWSVSEELISPAVYQALATVEGLRAGRTAGVREPEPVRAVPWGDVEACLPFMPGPVAGMVRLLWHTGGRCGELVRLTAADIDTSGAVWSATLKNHKTAYRGRERILHFGPEAQAVLRPLLLSTPPGRPLFSPLASVAEKSAKAPTHRRPNQKPNVRKTDRRVNEAYAPQAVGRAITRAIVLANRARAAEELPAIPHWHPHQIRHSYASRARQQFGIEAARTCLGHADAGVTLIYAEQDRELAATVAAKIG